MPNHNHFASNQRSATIVVVAYQDEVCKDHHSLSNLSLEAKLLQLV
jgi:hypothetical protein